MQITCPSCEAEYAVPDDKIAGRTVKCARCGQQWAPVPAPAVPAPAMAQAQASEPEPVPGWPPPPSAPRPQAATKGFEVAAALPAAMPLAGMRLADVRRAGGRLTRVRLTELKRPSALLAAWVASAVVLGIVVIVAYSDRGGIMQAWPPSQRLYGALGLN